MYIYIYILGWTERPPGRRLPARAAGHAEIVKKNYILQNIAILYKTHAEIVKKKTEILQNIVMLYKIHDEIIKKKTEILQNIVMLYNTDYVYIYIYIHTYTYTCMILYLLQNM